MALEAYKKIYHYTTLQGVYGILNSQSLWSTNYKFLNDYSEIILFKSKLIDFLRPKILEKYRKMAAKDHNIADTISKKGGIAICADSAIWLV